MNDEFFVVLSVVAGVAFWGYVIFSARRAPTTPASTRTQSGAAKQAGRVVGRLWSGHYGLPKTFWLGYVVLNNVFYVAVYFFARLYPAAGFIMLALLVGYLITASVGVWNAGNKHTGLWLWPIMAKVVVTLPLAGFVIAVGVVAVFQPNEASKSTGVPSTAPAEALHETVKKSTPDPNPFSDPDFGKDLAPVTQAGTAQSPSRDQATEAHYQAIYKAHPDADAVANSAQFQHWLTMYPAYRAVMDKGTAQQIIEMFTAFKMQRQQTFDPATARPVTQ